MSDASPFVAGARVVLKAGRYGLRDSSECTVEKAYKNGNFILQGDKTRQQYRPGQNWQTKEWTAWAAGHASGAVYLWTPERAAEVQREVAFRERQNRLVEIRRRIERTKPDEITEAQLDQIEGALPQKGESK